MPGNCPATAAGAVDGLAGAQALYRGIGAGRPHLAEAAYRRRRQRPAVLATDPALAAYVADRLAEGWALEPIAGG